MSNSVGTKPTLAELVIPPLDENPYATPKALGTQEHPENRLNNFQLHRLGYTLRAHGLLTCATLASGAAAYFLTYGPSPEIGMWLLLALFMLTVTLVMLTVLLVFVVLPLPMAVLTIVTMFVPVSWPLSFIAVHCWGRRILSQHSMTVGVFSGPRYVAKLAKTPD